MLFLNFLAQIPRGVPTLIVILSVIAILVIRKHTRGATGARARLRAILYLGFGLLIDLALVAELLLASDWLINNGWMPLMLSVRGAEMHSTWGTRNGFG